MEKDDFNYRVIVQTDSLDPSFEPRFIVDKGFEYFDDAETYFADQESVFEGDHDGFWLRIYLLDGPSEIKCTEVNEPPDPGDE